MLASKAQPNVKTVAADVEPASKRRVDAWVHASMKAGTPSSGSSQRGDSRFGGPAVRTPVGVQMPENGFDERTQRMVVLW